MVRLLNTKITFGSINMSKVLYPSVGLVEVVEVNDSSITVHGASTLMIVSGHKMFDQYKVGDKVYLAYALCKDKFALTD